MWENHLYGSEGGARNDRPYPYLRPSNKYREATSVWAQTGRLVQYPNRSAWMLDEPPRPRLPGDAFGDIFLTARTPRLNQGGECLPTCRMC